MSVNKMKKRFSEKNSKISWADLLVKFTRLTISNEKVEDFIEMMISLDKQGQSTAAALNNIVTKKEKILLSKNASTAFDTTLNFYKDIKSRFDESDNPTITTALQPYLNKTEIMIVGVSSNPTDALQAVLDFRSASRGNNGKIISAAIAPFIYLLAVIGMINFFDEKVVKQMVTLVASFGKEPQGLLELQVSIHEFVLSYQLYFMPVILGIGIAYMMFIPMLSGKHRNFLEKVPVLGTPFSLSRMINSGLFLKIVAFLYRNGATTSGALSAIIKNSTPFMKYEVGLIQEVHSLKGSAEEAFSSTLFVGDVSYMLSVYLAADDAENHMESIANKIDVLVTKKVVAIARIINLTGLLITSSYIILFVLTNLSISEYMN